MTNLRPFLTIAIPTYDRNAILSSHLPALLAQLTAACELLILDNHSPQAVALDFDPSELPCPVTLIRHPANLGVSANILRAVELARGEWLWILSDDDPVLNDAIATGLRAARAAGDAVFINFSSTDFARADSFSTVGTRQFVEKLDHFGHLLLISTNYYRVDSVRPFLRTAYEFAYTLCPQFALLQSAIGEQGKCHFLADQIVRWEMPPVAQRWSPLRFSFCSVTLLDLPRLDASTRRVLARKIQAVHPRLRSIWFSLLLNIRAGMRADDARIFFSEYTRRYAGLRLSFWQRGACHLAYYSFGFARACLALVIGLYRLFGRRKIDVDSAMVPFEARL